MEWLLLLLVGGVATAVGLWAARPGAGTPAERGTGPGSSPPLPAGDDRGKAVQLGDSPLKKELKDLLDKAPAKIQARGVPKKDEAQRHSKAPLKVTYNTDQLIARSSRIAHNRRVLQNAELLVQKQKGEEALELFERVKNRINDPEVQGKIQTNIDDIKRWMAGFESEEDQVKFPEIIVPLTLQNLALENLTDGIKQLSDSLVQKIGQTVAAVNAMQSPGAPPGVAQTGAMTSQPVILQQFIQPAPRTSPQIAGAPPTSGSAAPGAPMAFAAGPAPGQAAPSGAPPSAGGVVAAYPIGFMGQPQPGQIQPGQMPAGQLPQMPAFYPPRGEMVGDMTSGGTPPPRQEQLPHGMSVDANGELLTDGWTDEEFDREWEKYKNLPSHDRRSGIERRKASDRRGLDLKRKDRRSGEDRRKKDLFKEREDFLKKLEEHKRRKKELEEWKKKKQEQPAVPVPASPAARSGLGPEAIIEIANAVVNIGELPGDKPEGETPKKPSEKSEEETGEEKGSAGAAEEKKDKEAERVILETPPLELPPVRMPGEGDYLEGRVVDAARDLTSRPLMNIGLPPGLAIEDQMTAIGAAPAEATATEGGEDDIPEIAPLDEPEEPKEEKPQIQEIRGVLELKPPDEDDAPFLTLTYDFTKIPDSFKLSRDYHTMEYAYYKYKPMLVKAQEFTRRKMLKNALNYYRVIKSQTIPPEFKRMINRNIQDITEYLEKFLMSRT